MHPVKASTDSKAWPLWLGRIPLSEPRVFLNLLGLSWAIPSCQSSQKCWKLFPDLSGWRLGCSDIFLWNNRKKKKWKMWRLQACSLEKTYLITGSQQQSWPTNSLLKEIPPTVSSNLCSFWDELKKKIKGEKRGNKTSILLKKYYGTIERVLVLLWKPRKDRLGKRKVNKEAISTANINMSLLPGKSPSKGFCWCCASKQLKTTNSSPEKHRYKIWNPL